LEAYLAQRKKESEIDREFPDEMDTPMHVPARIRFQRYRGLKNFKKSEWDPYENLPIDYARIFQLDDFKKMKNKVLRSQNQSTGVAIGAFVTIFIKNVPKTVMSQENTKGFFFVYAPLAHEHKMSVLNSVITKNPNYKQEVRSKDSLVVFCGFRRYVVHPLFSNQVAPGAGKSKTKFERFLNPQGSSVATFFSKIQLAAAPVSFFKYPGEFHLIQNQEMNYLA
jgi:pre-rRNA-processing protein TSR1